MLKFEDIVMSNHVSEDTKTAYEQICKAHSEISDFRAKLLALLPLASGAGLFLLFSDKIDARVESHLWALGVFGALVTTGLFLHELRNIQICLAISDCGRELEECILKVKRGRFYDDPGPTFGGVVSSTWGAVIIYSSVIAVWSYIAGLGFYGLNRGGLAKTISVAVFFAVVLLSSLASWAQRRELKNRKGKMPVLLRDYQIAEEKVNPSAAT
jgi:hypothetical protein